MFTKKAPKLSKVKIWSLSLLSLFKRLSGSYFLLLYLAFLIMVLISLPIVALAQYPSAPNADNAWTFNAPRSSPVIIPTNAQGVRVDYGFDDPNHPFSPGAHEGIDIGGYVDADGA